MKKLLSIVISILMISAMMSAVAFADGEATITLSGTMTGLVAGEAVTLTPAFTGFDATTYTVEVNSQVFGITDGAAVEGKTIIKKENIPVASTFELTVNASIPQTFTSDIKITAGAVSQKFTISVADRLVGDADGNGSITMYDALQIAAKFNNKVVDASFKEIAADADGNGSITMYDALQIAAKFNNKPVDNANLGVAYLGGNAATVIADPFVGGEEPAEPTALTAPAHLYAYYQDGKLYYTFDGDANASSYTITVGAQTFNNVSTTSGSLTVTAWDGTGTLSVSVIAKGDGVDYADSTATSTDAVYANVSGQLASWLATNGLSDVAITVYEITAAE